MVEAATAAKAGQTVPARRALPTPSGTVARTSSSSRYVVVDDSKLLRRPHVLRSTDSLATAIKAAERTGSAKVWIIDTATPTALRYRSALPGTTVQWVTL
jgi:hypothetical protein